MALATPKQSITAHIIAQDSARTNEMVRESAKAEESPTSPELAKGPSVTSQSDGCESLGQAVGAQGALIRPERFRGCEHTSVRRRAVPATTSMVSHTERLIRRFRSRKAETRCLEGVPPEDSPDLI